MKIKSGYRTVWTAGKKTSGIICLVLGICVILGGCIHFLEGQRFQSRAVETTAEIMRIDRYSRGENTAYEMTLQFETASGEQVTAILDSKHPTKEVGDTMTVFYDPQAPEQVRRPFNKNISLAIGGGGLLFAAFGIVALVKDKREQTPADDR